MTATLPTRELPTRNATEQDRTAWVAEQNLLQPIREAYFRLVQPASHWKDRIDAVLPSGISLDQVRDAVVHFTGTVPSFTDLGNGTTRVTAAGYRAGPCGDH